MAAANTDLFSKVSRKWVGQIGAGGVANATDTTIPLSSATNLPADTGVIAIINRVDANGVKTPTLEESVIGVVSGTNLITCTRGIEGTAQAHSAGSVVEILITAKGWNNFIDGFLVGHTQLGAHIANLPLTTPKITTSINDSGGNELFKTTATASAVNEFTVANAITTAGPILSVTGSDTDIDANINPKGTGRIKSGTVAVPTISSTDTLTNKTLTKPVINGTNPTGATYTPATGAQTVALDCAANNMHIVTGHADGTAITFTVANATNNQPFIVSILQGAVVSTITAWFATIRWAGGAPTLTATVAKRDTFGFIRTGAATYDGFKIGQGA